MNPSKYFLKYTLTKEPGVLTWRWVKKRDHQEIESSKEFNSYQECRDSYRIHKGVEQCLQTDIEPHTIYRYDIPDVGGGTYAVDTALGPNKENLELVEARILQQIIQRHGIIVFKDGEPVEHYSLSEKRYSPTPFSIMIVPDYGSIEYALTGNYGFVV
ncbi:hypothetical protein [Pseudomonas oryzihabitans]|uniref:hypothetical protein n=1 Tax=Pseudomonas oryzihabitans TaxID=47885 RepID=UPI00135D9DF6|nr:hypothetical protein [Pseudomonas oryzihabitans]MXS18451.1 hypothetical protein [Pseudomonas oryzihabitans]